MTDIVPTEREMEILKVLWELQEASVRQVHEQLEPVSGLHFNTVQTQLRIMDDKKLVAHRRDGRSFLYRALCSREQLSSQFLHKLYDGAVDQLVLNMISSENLSSKELAELEAMIAKARQKKKQSPKKGK
ncbi:BlaI/MecI/CopY family transcriptional regulator [Blastopirellula marina]|uniref:CopY family transcriptional regulator n=1 Tax=Blastopirellula marina TaxID=124 RepID=A0A2S8FPC7_9BACT|nr:BlaI/MecI/CopY family transcriptional regulator [Blastopirellula marina]PQO33704.1 CopY family transcriptional regulator [Blastopirellula marina]PTL43491.1 BlaI/MecI/CopY family transcriptional regulator [Blastopirellula marina]